MNKAAQSIVVALLGGVMVAITLTGRFTAYVKSGFGPFLLLGGLVLILVGIGALVLPVLSRARAARARTVPDDHDVHDHEAHDHDGHDHDRSRAPWLVLVPVLVMLVIAPPALGADSLEQNSGSQADLLDGGEPLALPEPGTAPTSGQSAPATDASGGTAPATPDPGAGTKPGGTKPGGTKPGGFSVDENGRRVKEFPPLAGPESELQLREFVQRALYDKDDSVVHTPVTVIGFVGPAGKGFTEGWSLARLAISCCAADATAIRLHVEGEPPYPADTWLRVVVTAVPLTATKENQYVPTVVVSSMEVIDAPDDPYETTFG